MDDDHAALFADVLDLTIRTIIRHDGRRSVLTESETVILAVLAQARGEWKRKASLATAIYGGEWRWATTWAACIGNHMSLVKPKIEGCTFGIESDVGRGSLGYRLTGHLRVRAWDGTVT